MRKAIYSLGAEFKDSVYGPENEAAIRSLVDIADEVQTTEMLRANPAVLRDVEIIMGGWWMPPIDADLLAAAPKLQAIFYAAGSIRQFATEPMWDRGIVVSSAYAANAIPVAEYTVAAILLSLKRFWYSAFGARCDGQFPPRRPIPGAYRTTVGLVSLGMVGRHVIELLRHFELRVIAYDPFVTPAEAALLGIELVRLADLFQQADVVSLHTPLLPVTAGMITGAHLASMKEGASFINTARGAVVRESEMIAVLQQRPDLTAILDVTDPEPPAEGSVLFGMPNVILTPHIAGSQDLECRRLGQYMVEELRRYLAGQPLKWPITRQQADRLA